ncbi:coiled-coil domain-containing protein [Streptomyces lydicus]|uniref:hypothetical protein n=1 Tax=Streptomyces lydicus TaxID=47763 RepID=UPI0036F75B44
MRNDLDKVSEELPPEVQALAKALRELFSGLDLGIRRYAARKHRDAGAISRNLNGTRVPPWEFVSELFKDVAEVRQQPVQAQVLEHVRHLHREALRVSNKRLYEIQILQDKLEQADRNQQHAEMREQALLEALQTRQRRIAELQTERQALESTWISEKMNHAKEFEQARARESSQEEEIRRLNSEVTRLEEELRIARQLTLEAEEKCTILENQLDQAEESGPSTEELRDITTQELSELRSMNENLQAQLDDLRKQSSDIEELRRRRRARATSEAQQKEWVASATPQELTDELIKVYSTDGEDSASRIEYAIGMLKPAIEAYQTVEKLSMVGQTASITRILVVFSDTDVSNVFDMLQLLQRGNYTEYAHSVVSWFAWKRSGEHYIELFTLLKESGDEVTADYLLLQAGDNRPSGKLADLIGDTDPSDAKQLCKYAAAKRNSDQLPSLIRALRLNGLNNYADLCTQETVAIRPQLISYLERAFKVSDSMIDLEIVRSARQSASHQKPDSQLS